MVGGESIKGPWTGGGASAPALPTTPELEQLRGQASALREELAEARASERRLRERCRRTEIALSRAATVLRALAPTLSDTVHAIAMATFEAQAHAADDAGELPF